MLAVCILGWIQNRNITEAIQLGKALFDQVALWTHDALLVWYAGECFLTAIALDGCNLYVRCEAKKMPVAN